MRLLGTLGAAAGVLLAGCAHTGGDTPRRSAETVLEYDTRPAQCTNSVLDETTYQGAWCRFTIASDLYEQASDRYQYATVAHNVLRFGAAVYAGSTLALNSGGLRESQTDDLTETALVLGVLAAADNVFGIQRRNTLFLNASKASACYAAHTTQIMDREANLEALLQDESGSIDAHERRFRLERALQELNSRIPAAVSSLQAGETRQQSQIAAAQQLAAEAQSAINALKTQRQVFEQLDNELRLIASDFSRQVRTRERDAPVDYQALVTAIQQSAAAGVPQTGSSSTTGAVDASGAQEEFVNRSFDALAEAMEKVQDELALAQRLTPALDRIRASLLTCVTILDTGGSVSINPGDSPIGP